MMTSSSSPRTGRPSPSTGRFARHSSSRAFTLVELLVVIGIIALLISVLMPALSRAREQANAIKCLSNMKQIGIALLMYAEQHKGKTLRVWPNDYRGAPFLWDYSYHSMLLPYMQNNKQVYVCPSRPEAAYITKADPTFEIEAGIATDYAYNETGWSEPGGTYEGYLCDGRPIQKIAKSSEKIWMSEASCIAPERDGWQVSWSTDGYGGPLPPPDKNVSWREIYNAPGTNPAWFSAVEKERHNRGNNVLFYDNHAEHMQSTLGRNWRPAH
jgi:prepilin-type N-terminal cleavage/methylation domain-containing protein/prepilin-type processing-associated H-X9-DG protein